MIGGTECELYGLVVKSEASTLKLTAVFEPATDGGFTCHFAELPEVFSEGETVAEARGNLWDALEQVMAYHREESRKSASPHAQREELHLAVS